MKTISLMLLAALSLLPGQSSARDPSKPTSTIYYSGSIGSLPVFVCLRFVPKSGNLAASGRYSYRHISTESSGGLYLEGTISSDGKIELTERSNEEHSAVTGHFSGIAPLPYDKLSGAWTDDSNSSKVLPFSLVSYAELESLHFESPQGSIAIPAFRDANSPLSNIVRKELEHSAQLHHAEAKSANSRLSGRFQLTYYSANVISLSGSVSAFVNPNLPTKSEAFTFGFKAGRPTRLELSDLFSPGSDWLTRLGRVVKQHFKQQSAHAITGYLPIDISGFAITEGSKLQLVLEPAKRDANFGQQVIDVELKEISDILAEDCSVSSLVPRSSNRRP